MNCVLDKELELELQNRNLSFERASLSDLEGILSLYQERMQWFQEKKIKQWTRYLVHHPKEEFMDVINHLNYFILKENNEIIAGFELSTDSRYWNDKTISAYYIYKLVVRPGYRNLGTLIFEICKNICKNNHIYFLRLDCLKNNNQLNQIYHDHGFKLISYGYTNGYSYSLREIKIDEN